MIFISSQFCSFKICLICNISSALLTNEAAIKLVTTSIDQSESKHEVLDKNNVGTGVFEYFIAYHMSENSTFKDIVLDYKNSFFTVLT